MLGVAGRIEASQDNVLITEFMAINDHTLTNQDGVYPDWIEIYNAGANAVNLSGWRLTDDAANLTKWQFPAISLPSGVSAEGLPLAIQLVAGPWQEPQLLDVARWCQARLGPMPVPPL